MTRCFVGIDPSAELRDALVQKAKRIESQAPDFFRWTPPDSMHLTLAFLGEVDDEALESIQTALAAVQAESTEVGLGEVTRIPEPNTPRVLAATLTGELAPLRSLQQRVVDATSALASHEERRGFSPHITFGRLKRGKPSNAKAVKRALAELNLPPITPFRVESFALVASELGPQGPKYRTLREYPLG